MNRKRRSDKGKKRGKYKKFAAIAATTGVAAGLTALELKRRKKKKLDPDIIETFKETAPTPEIKVKMPEVPSAFKDSSSLEKAIKEKIKRENIPKVKDSNKYFNSEINRAAKEIKELEEAKEKWGYNSDNEKYKQQYRDSIKYYRKKKRESSSVLRRDKNTGRKPKKMKPLTDADFFSKYTKQLITFNRKTRSDKGRKRAKKYSKTQIATGVGLAGLTGAYTANNIAKAVEAGRNNGTRTRISNALGRLGMRGTSSPGKFDKLIAMRKSLDNNRRNLTRRSIVAGGLLGAGLAARTLAKEMREEKNKKRNKLR